MMNVPALILQLLLPLFFLLMQANYCIAQEEDFRHRREEMVKKQIEGRGVSDKAVLKAMRSVKRHLFVPPALAAQAYADTPLPIGLGQTISQPYIVAYMTQVLHPTPTMKVLEIGAGSGYQAAVLAEIVKSVYTIEIGPEHGKAAAERLEKFGYKNVQVQVGDGYMGWAEHAPYDAIIVTAGAEHVPPQLVEQLKEGGRMVIPVGPQHRTQSLLLLQKNNGKVTSQNLLPVTFVPFTRSKPE